MKGIKYIFAVIFILGGFGSIIKGSVIAGMISIFLGIMILPLASDQINLKFKSWNYKNVRYGIYFILLILIGANIKQPTRKKKKNNLVEIPTSNEKSKTKYNDELKQNEIQIDNSTFWNEFDPIVKERIYKMIKEKDCRGLQKEFNVTADNMDRLQARGKSASRNLELMDFLQDQMNELKCNE